MELKRWEEEGGVVAVETGNHNADPPTPTPAPQLALAQSGAITGVAVET